MQYVIYNVHYYYYYHYYYHWYYYINDETNYCI